MGFEVDDGEQARAFAEATRAVCRRHEPPELASDGFPEAFWRDLAELGFFSLATSDEAAVEIAAVMEELGGHGSPGPLWETVLAVRALDPAAAAGVIDGSTVVSVGVAPLMPWAARAGRFVELAADGVWECTVDAGAAEAVMLTGDRWQRVSLTRRRPLPQGEPALALADVALAAYLAGAGGRLLRDASAYAATRTQFHRPIGDFQGVAFPLADLDVSLAAARALARRAAIELASEDQSGGAHHARAALRSAARAAAKAVSVCFQAYGAMAFTEECDAAYFGRRIAQLLTQAQAPHRRERWITEILQDDREGVSRGERTGRS